MAVQFEKDGKRRERNSFVAIDKRMIPQQRPGQRSAKLRNAGHLGIGFQISRPADGGLKGILVSNPGEPSVALNQAAMHVAQHVRSNELQAHFASSR